MTNEEGPSELRFSLDTRKGIHQVLVHVGQLDSDIAAALTDRIELMAGAVSPEDEMPNPARIKRELQAIQQSVKLLNKSLGGLSRYTISSLYNAARESTEEIPYDSDDVRGSSIRLLRTDANNLDSIASLAIDRTHVTRGSLPKVAARYTAYFVAECLWNENINVTSYEDGLYFQILRLVFAEAMPDLGDEAYRRHGNWAIKNKGNIEVHFSYAARQAK